MITLQSILVVTAILFGLGLITVLTRKNAVGVLMGVELLLNAASINLVAMSHFHGGDLAGHLFAIFVIVLAASEAAVALAIVVSLFQHLKTIDTQEAVTLRG